MKKNNINTIVIIIKRLSLIIMTIEFINNNYYYLQIYINELIKIILNYFR